MYRKHLSLAAILLSIVFLVIAMCHYPGGSQADAHSTGYDWKNNYLCNLFFPQAVNGADNGGRPWAILGWFFMCAGVAVSFFEFSSKITRRGAAAVIRYGGIGSMVFGFL